MDLEALKEVIKEKAGMEVGLRYKTIYQGKQVELTNDTTVVWAIHIELDIKWFNKNFQYIMSIYGRSKLGFDNSRRMYL